MLSPRGSWDGHGVSRDIIGERSLNQKKSAFSTVTCGVEGNECNVRRAKRLYPYLVSVFMANGTRCYIVDQVQPSQMHCDDMRMDYIDCEDQRWPLAKFEHFPGSVRP